MKKTTVVKIFYLMTFLGNLDPQYTTAADTTRRALLETYQLQSDIKELTKEAERQVYNTTGLTPQEIAYAGYMYPIISGSISTKPFKNFKYEKDGVTLIPEIEYNYKQDTVSANLIFVKSF